MTRRKKTEKKTEKKQKLLVESEMRNAGAGQQKIKTFV